MIKSQSFCNDDDADDVRAMTTRRSSRDNLCVTLNFDNDISTHLGDLI